jgi:hypothetical protein
MPAEPPAFVMCASACATMARTWHVAQIERAINPLAGRRGGYMLRIAEGRFSLVSSLPTPLQDRGRRPGLMLAVGLHGRAWGYDDNARG